MACELCDDSGGEELWRSATCRVVRIDDARFPGFCRVVLNRHAREMTDLEPAERAEVMRVVFAVERAVRHVYHPDKINLASLGNVTPHVHWHVIPRWHDDSHFPDPIWAPARRQTGARSPVADDADALARELVRELLALLAAN